MALFYVFLMLSGRSICLLFAAAELSDEEATEEYESVIIPIYEELVIDCLYKIMSDPEAWSRPDLARIYGELMVRQDKTEWNACRVEYNTK